MVVYVVVIGFTTMPETPTPEVDTIPGEQMIKISTFSMENSLCRQVPKAVNTCLTVRLEVCPKLHTSVVNKSVQKCAKVHKVR